MRNIIVSMRLTLDGFVAGPHGEMDWMEAYLDEALGIYESELQQEVDTVLFGRETYQGFESYWPEVAQDPASPEGMVEYARRLNDLRKIVWSRTLTEVTWNNTTLLRDLVPEEISRLKQEPGRDIVIYGSTSIVQSLIKLDLIDRYQLLVFPVVLGRGKPLFQDISREVKLSLVSTTKHPSGVVRLVYQTKNE